MASTILLPWRRCLQPHDCLSRWDNWNAFNATEGEQMALVPGNDQVRSTRDPGSQDRIVLRVRRQVYDWKSVDNRTERLQVVEQVVCLRGQDVRLEGVTSQHRPQLLDLIRRRDEHEVTTSGGSQQTSGRASPRYEPAHQNVGVKNDPHEPGLPLRRRGLELLRPRGACFVPRLIRRSPKRPLGERHGQRIATSQPCHYPFAPSGSGPSGPCHPRRLCSTGS